MRFVVSLSPMLHHTAFGGANITASTFAAQLKARGVSGGTEEKCVPPDAAEVTDNAAKPRCATKQPQPSVQYPALATETRTHVNTACAAYWLGRKHQTLRAWACLENGPIRPIRVNGRLAWAVADIRRVLRQEVVNG